MISKYPHTATIAWYDAGTKSVAGVWSVGTLNTIKLDKCDIQPTNGRLTVGEGGAVLDYNWKVFSPLFSGLDSIPKDAKLTFFSADHIIVHLFPHQTHVEIKCQD